MNDLANPFNPDDDMDDAPCCGDPDIIDETGNVYAETVEWCTATHL